MLPSRNAMLEYKLYAIKNFLNFIRWVILTPPPLMKQVFHPSSWELIVHVTLQYSMHVRENLAQYARVDSRVQRGKFDCRQRQDHKIVTKCKLTWSSFVEVHGTGFDYMIHDLRTDIFQALFMKLPVIAWCELLTATLLQIVC